jgi:hypothetical protein
VLAIDPTDTSSGWERALYYEAGKTSGHEKTYEVHSRNAAHEDDIDEKLNLNVASLGIARRAALDGVIDELARKHKEGWTRAVLEHVIKRYEGRDSRGRHAPFCEAIVFYLRKRLARCPR